MKATQFFKIGWGVGLMLLLAACGVGLDDGVVACREVRDVEAAIVALVTDFQEGIDAVLERETGAAERLALLILD